MPSATPVTAKATRIQRVERREVAAPAGGEETQVSMPFHPNDAGNTTSGWLSLTQSCLLRAEPT